MLNKQVAYKYKVDKKMRWYGLCDFENETIKINPTKGDVINSILHEEIHRKHPSWDEKRVVQETKKVESRLSIKQSRDLLDDLLNKIKNNSYGKRKTT